MGACTPDCEPAERDKRGIALSLGSRLARLRRNRRQSRRLIIAAPADDPVPEIWPPALYSREGYEALATAAQDALEQAQRGKGHLRHGDDETPWTRQVVFQVQGELGPAFSAGQYAKKMAESMRLEPGARRRELLGAAVYALSLVVYFDGEDASG
jgi:hypothetical protein